MSRVLIIGCGGVAPDTALACSFGGVEITLHDFQEEALKRADALISKNRKTALERGEITQALYEESVGLVTFTTSLDTAAPMADLIIEALPDDFDMKRDLFIRLHAVCPAPTVFATTSSAFSIGRLAQICGRPDRFVGLRIPGAGRGHENVEIALGAQTGEAALRIALEVVRRMERTNGH